MYEKVQAAADCVLSSTKLRPKIGLILGSGLGAFADDLVDAARTRFDQIPHFPKCSALGHAGNFVVGKVGNVPIAALQGRIHFYEGHSMESVVFPVRVMAAMGIRKIILTNAAGGISEKLERGCLVVLTDHINLQGTNPLIGPNEDRFGVRYPDMTTAYDAEYRQLTMREGLNLGTRMHEGVYLAVPGPSYETPAEIRAFRILGADVVGMSTVPEVIAARHLGMRILAISCVTNLAAGRNTEPLTHKEVMETGVMVRGQFMELLKAVIPEIDRLSSNPSLSSA